MNDSIRGMTDYQSTAGFGGAFTSITTGDTQGRIQAQHKPSMGSKLSKVAEIFEMDIIDEVEALKACQVIIGQHAKPQAKTVEDSVKVIK